jgi:hypothetical protein
MLITIQRRTYTDESTQGELLLNGAHEAYTLEPRAVKFAPLSTVPPIAPMKPYAVPAGIYDYVVGPSLRFGRNVIKVESVPGFADIEVHPGNFPGNSHGCCCVGETESENFVGQSDDAFDALMEKIPPVGQIEYQDFIP